jgi:hypothetical protein
VRRGSTRATFLPRRVIVTTSRAVSASSSRVIAYFKLAFKRQGRESYLCLADNTDRLKLDGERQLGDFKYSSCRQRRSVAAVLALISFRLLA